MNGKMIFSLLKSNQVIADLGSGLNPSHWWPSIKDNSTIDAFDLNFVIEPKDERHFFFLQDVTKMKDSSDFKKKYNLIVADHIFEHVYDMDGMVDSIDWIANDGCVLHVGIPVANNFTDTFYRLIHRYESGGHVQRFRYEDPIRMLDRIGFKLIKSEPWEDDWVWLEKCFSLEHNSVKNVTQDEIQYLVDTFRKELTPEKGYLYGYEYVFERK